MMAKPIKSAQHWTAGIYMYFCVHNLGSNLFLCVVCPTFSDHHSFYGYKCMLLNLKTTYLHFDPRKSVLVRMFSWTSNLDSNIQNIFLLNITKTRAFVKSWIVSIVIHIRLLNSMITFTVCYVFNFTHAQTHTLTKTPATAAHPFDVCRCYQSHISVAQNAYAPRSRFRMFVAFNCQAPYYYYRVWTQQLFPTSRTHTQTHITHLKCSRSWRSFVSRCERLANTTTAHKTVFPVACCVHIGKIKNEYNIHR